MKNTHKKQGVESLYYGFFNHEATKMHEEKLDRACPERSRMG